MMNKRKNCIICEKPIKRSVIHKRLKKRRYATCSKECAKVLQRVRVYLINLKGAFDNLIVRTWEK